MKKAKRPKTLAATIARKVEQEGRYGCCMSKGQKVNNDGRKAVGKPKPLVEEADSRETVDALGLTGAALCNQGVSEAIESQCILLFFFLYNLNKKK
ncbi:hypothetical protein [Hymenobacter elongatus]|uniref:hypothetical protein n=1 Tax=Hymenobacter elongatus TaxID=877208 RepID=UPI0014369B45|nr:hypothetical protein [Hymenobacter elongatus]